MSVIFPNTASLLFRQESSPWYNGFNAPGSGSNGQLTFTNMDYNWYYLNSASYQTITVIKGAAYTGSANTFTEPQTFTSNVGISGSLSGSSARFSGQVISSYPGIGFLGTASWAANAITSSVLVITSSISSSYASASTSASLIYITASQTNADYTLVFKNSTGTLGSHYELAADGTNGPYYNPSTNTLTTGVVSGSSANFTSLTGSLSGSVIGNITGTASFATSASQAITASYADNGVNSLTVGAFYDTTTQTLATNVSASMTFNSTTISDGISVVSNSRLTATKAGTYNIQFSSQFIPQGPGSSVYVWLRKNGTNVAYSNTEVYMKNSNEATVAAWNFIETLTPGQYLELIWYPVGGTVNMIAEAPIPGSGGNGNVGIPSVIVTMTQVK
jgi:hypothetical protein